MSELFERRFAVTRVPAWMLASLLCGAALLPGLPAWAAGTAAGTIIDNTAQVDFDIGGASLTRNSNTVRITVDERIDVVVTMQCQQVLVNSGGVARSVLFAVLNTGKG